MGLTKADNVFFFFSWLVNLRPAKRNDNKKKEKKLSPGQENEIK